MAFVYGLPFALAGALLAPLCIAMVGIVWVAEIEDVVEYLAPGGVGECEPGQALERVVARTSGAGGEQ